MEEKKSRKADLERRRPLWFVAGFVASATLLIVAIETVTVSGDGYDYDGLSALDYPYDEPLPSSLYIEEITVTRPDEEPAELDADRIIVSDEVATKPDEPDLDAAIAEMEAVTLADLLQEESPAEREATIETTATVATTEANDATTMPQFPGGTAAFKRWIAHRLRYPEQARAQGLQGDVVVSFIVREDGTTSDHKIVKSAGQPFDDEALRVVRTMPRWAPATDGNNPCIAMVAVPITFRM